MTLILAHPEAAAVSCSTCKAWVHGPDWKVVKRGGVPQARPPGMPTPCHSCPKESPAKAAQLELTAANRQTLRLFLRSRATAGACLNEEERNDELLLRNFALIDVIFRRWEREQQTTGWLEAFTLVKGK